MQLRVHPAAQQEMVRAVQWLRREFGPHAAVRLAQRIDEASQMLQLEPALGTPAAAGARQLALTGYPFSRVYREQSDDLHVLALRHHRRLPGYWAGRR